MQKTMLMMFAATVLMVATPALAATKTYQVTGPVLELTADKIVVQKGKDKWELARGTAEVPATVKEGSKVTIEYTMTAATVVDKDAAKPAKEPKAKDAAPKK